MRSSKLREPGLWKIQMIEIKPLIAIIDRAAHAVMSVYQQPEMEVTTKEDNSLLTMADHASHSVICEKLTQLHPDIPIISEEAAVQQTYAERSQWEYCFLLDPLDGTKEFVRRNDEFTINLALIKNGKPVLGIIHAPALNITYYAQQGKGAYKIDHGKTQKLSPQQNPPGHPVRVVMSRSHGSPAIVKFLQDLTDSGSVVTSVRAGSALKFGLIAEGKADVYPRHGKTMEWDTAAGQIIVNEVGKKVLSMANGEELQYNKTELFNPDFIVR